MKKSVAVLALLILFFSGCELDVDNIYVQHQSGDLYFLAEGETETLTIYATTNWIMNVSEEWLTATPLQGESGEAVLTYTAAPNATDEERTATVIIMAGEAYLRFSVTQAKPEVPEE